MLFNVVHLTCCLSFLGLLSGSHYLRRGDAVVMYKHMYIMCITVAYDYYTMHVYVDDVI